MKTSVINFKVDSAIKKKAQKKAQELGFSLSSVLNAYLKKFIKVKSVDFTTQEEEPSDYLIQALKESAEDIKAGRVSPSFDNTEDADAWLDDPNARYANGSPVER